MHTLHLDEQVTWARPAATRAIDAMTHVLTPRLGEDAQLAALRQVAMMVEREALTLTYNDVLLLMSLAFFLAAPLTLFLARPGAAPAGAAH